MRKIIVTAVLAFLAVVLLSACSAEAPCTGCTTFDQMERDAQSVGQAAANVAATAKAQGDALVQPAINAGEELVNDTIAGTKPALTVTSSSYDHATGMVRLEVTVWNYKVPPSLTKIDGVSPASFPIDWKKEGSDSTGGIHYSAEFEIEGVDQFYFGNGVFSPFIGGMIIDEAGNGFGEDPANCGWKRNP